MKYNKNLFDRAIAGMSLHELANLSNFEMNQYHLILASITKSMPILRPHNSPEFVKLKFLLKSRFFIDTNIVHILLPRNSFLQSNMDMSSTYPPMSMFTLMGISNDDLIEKVRFNYKKECKTILIIDGILDEHYSLSCKSRIETEENARSLYCMLVCLLGIYHLYGDCFTKTEQDEYNELKSLHLLKSRELFNSSDSLNERFMWNYDKIPLANRTVVIQEIRKIIPTYRAFNELDINGDSNFKEVVRRFNAYFMYNDHHFVLLEELYMYGRLLR